MCTSDELGTPACFVAEGLACDGFGVRASEAAAMARIRGIIDARAALERSPLDGDVATIDHRGAYGWALDTAHPSAPVALEFVVDGAALGHAIADVRRPDLGMAGLGEGRCGFLLRLHHPLPAARPAIATLRRIGDGAEMPRTPLVLVQPVGESEEFTIALEREMKRRRKTNRCARRWRISLRARSIGCCRRVASAARRPLRPAKARACARRASRHAAACWAAVAALPLVRASRALADAIPLAIGVDATGDAAGLLTAMQSGDLITKAADELRIR